jgi:multiple sugar transport system substrate-binding protein
MSKNILKLAFPVVVILSILLASCGPTETPVPTQPTEPPVVPTEVMTEEPTPSVDPTGQTVTFWHVWGTGLPNETMLAIVDQFNATNEWGITVEALDQGSYSTLEDAFNAAVQSGDLPDLVTGYSNAMANWYAVDAVVDLTPFENDPFFGLSAADWDAIYTGAIDGGKAPDGVSFAFPISQSANVIFYNSQWAQELGFPNAPANHAEFIAQACAAMEANNTDDNPDNDGTGGYVLAAKAENLASWVFANGGTMLTADRTAYDFTDQTVVDVADFLKGMWDSGCAFATESYPNPEFASRRALFVTSSTAGLPYQVDAFEAEGAINDSWTIIPFPGENGGKGVDAYGQYVAIGNTNPERMMATWVFVKYLTSPEVQAQWIEGSNYYPTRSETVQYLDAYMTANPIWAYGLTFMQYGVAEPAWPSWSTVRRAVGDTLYAILQGTPEDIPTLLEDLNTKAAEAVVETQE